MSTNVYTPEVLPCIICICLAIHMFSFVIRFAVNAPSNKHASLEIKVYGMLTQIIWN